MPAAFSSPPDLDQRCGEQKAGLCSSCVCSASGWRGRAFCYAGELSPHLLRDIGLVDGRMPGPRSRP